MSEFATKIVQENDYARSQRSQWDSLWQKIADYELPSMSEFTQRLYPGQEQGSKITNEIGLLSNRRCAIGVNSFLMGEGTTWFDLRVPDARIENNHAVRAWLDYLKSVMYTVFNSPGSGFGTAKSPVLRQITAFGNGPLYMGQSRSGWPVYRPEFLGNCAVITDDSGAVVGLYRQYQQTAFALGEQFGTDGLPDAVRAVLDNEPQRKFTCVHAVRPRRKGDPYDLANKRWIEAYVLKDTGDLLEAPEGYWDFPWLFARWDMSPNESYGRGPGEDALQSVLSLQRSERDIAKAISMGVDPMWLMEDESGFSPRINQVPGGYAWGRRDGKGNWNIEPLRYQGDIAGAEWWTSRIERRVEDLFFLDAFRMVEKISKEGSVVHMSATEFAGRQADQFRYAGPALERLRSEFLFRLIGRTASILIRNGIVPLPPPELRGAPIHPEYVSPLATAQRNTEGTSVLQTINDLLPLAQVDPKALDVVNIPRASRVLARARHAPVEILNSPDEIAAMQQARADAAQQQMQLQQMSTVATATRDNAQARKLLRESA